MPLKENITPQTTHMMKQTSQEEEKRKRKAGGGRGDLGEGRALDEALEVDSFGIDELVSDGQHGCRAQPHKPIVPRKIEQIDSPSRKAQPQLARNERRDEDPAPYRQRKKTTGESQDSTQTVPSRAGDRTRSAWPHALKSLLH